MKMLDEVIKAWSICFSNNSRSDCTGCPYADEDGNAACFNHDREDALHYIKVLKDILDPLKVKKISCEITCPQCNSVIAILLPESNETLTWDELRQMEGKPVWVEQCNGDTKGWLLILRINYDVITCTTRHGNSFYLYKSSYGEKWQAYRKERT